MSRPQRTWTLDELHAEKCEDVGECWEWTGSMSGRKGRMPTIQANGKVQQAHVFTWLLAKGLAEKPDGLRFWHGCTNHKCVNPAHVSTGSTKQMFTALRQSGTLKRKPDTVAKITNLRRQRGTKLSTEIVAAVRLSDESNAAEAAKYGCHRSTIVKARAGLSWRDGVHGSSVFNMGPT